MTADLVFVGLGARTPVGLTAESAAAAVRAGISRVRGHPFMVDAVGEPLVTAYDDQLDHTLLGWRRLAPLALSALLAVAPRTTDGDPAPTFSALVALPEPRPGMSEVEATLALQQIQEGSAAARIRGRIDAMLNGHAGALHALREAAGRLRRRECDLVAVGGVDSYLDADVLAWLASSRRLACSNARSGFHPGEGAAFVLLASSDTAKRLNMSPYARLRGAFTSTEERPIGRGKEVLGQGLSAAIAGAAANLRLPDERVDTVYCDINGERYRNDEWALAVLRIQHFLRGPAYESPADCWGDVGAASAALGCVLAIRAWARDYARGPRALVWAGSDSGLRSAAVLERLS